MVAPLGKPDNTASAASGRNPSGWGKAGAPLRCGS